MNSNETPAPGGGRRERKHNHGHAECASVFAARGTCFFWRIHRAEGCEWSLQSPPAEGDTSAPRAHARTLRHLLPVRSFHSLFLGAFAAPTLTCKTALLACHVSGDPNTPAEVIGLMCASRLVCLLCVGAVRNKRILTNQFILFFHFYTVVQQTIQFLSRASPALRSPKLVSQLSLDKGEVSSWTSAINFFFFVQFNKKAMFA